MAKSIRASVSKRNRATLRKNFFGPIVDARTERLHAKLQELADKPRPEAPEKSKREQAEVEAGRCIAHHSRIQAYELQTKQPRPNLEVTKPWMSTPRPLRASRRPLVCKSATRSLATPLFSRSANLPAREDPRNKGILEWNQKGVWGVSYGTIELHDVNMTSTRYIFKRT
ncbi:unnamed protein product [Penicillium salamii]|nr:unnamed protein product [Penicillium salamii]CAG8401721.1 unnamed protein product [Penicillium salamii]